MQATAIFEVSERELPADALRPYGRMRERDTDPAYADALVIDIYARISQSRGDKMEKTDRQIAVLLRHLAGTPHRLGRILRDDNRSAWKRNGKRPGWDAVLARVLTGDSNGIISTYVDRVTRQTRDVERLLDAVIDNGLTVVVLTPDDVFDLRKPNDRHSLKQEALSAEHYSLKVSQKQRDREKWRREDGLGHGGPRPFGQESGPKARTQVDPDVVAQERQAIRDGVADYLRGVPLMHIAAEWQRRGFTGKTPVHVRQIFLQSRLAGLAEHEPGVFTERTDIDEPIIDRVTWERLRDRLLARSHGRPPVSGMSITGGVVVCAACGKPLTHRRNGERVQYRCPARNGCNRTTINADALENLLRECVVRELSSSYRETWMDERQAALTAQREQLRVAVEERDTLADRCAREGLGPAEYALFARAHRERVEQLEASLAALELSAGPIEYDQRDLRSTLPPAQRWEEGSPNARGRMVREAFRVITVEPAAGRRMPPVERIAFTRWTTD